LDVIMHLIANQFILEESYLSTGDLGTLLVHWIRIVGSLSIAFLVLCELFRWIRGVGSSWSNGLSGNLRNLPADQAWRIRSYRLFLLLALVGAGAALSYLVLEAAQGKVREHLANILLVYTFGCAAAVLAVSWEFLIDLPRFSWRRIWAIGLFSIREALRRKVLWSFCLLLLIFLFASWFIRTGRPEDQWRIYVELVFFVMGALILLTAGVIACFSLPTDIRQQTIHTVVTKPVEKFEVLLGRIVGIVTLMSAILLVVSHLSLLYVFRGIDPNFRQEVMRARIRFAGGLTFEALNEAGEWTARRDPLSVGREWQYRQYIRGSAPQEAVWRFANPPSTLANKDLIPVVFNFDIYRTTKGGEDYREGVSCEFTFINTAKWDGSKYSEYREGVDPATRQPLTEAELARRYGYYRLPAPRTIVDYKTYSVNFPRALLEDLGNAVLEVRVACTTPNQYLGANEADLYILAGEGNFYLNYLKGISAIWFIMVIVVCLAVVFSAYLSALICFFLTTLLTGCGAPRLRDYVLRLTSADQDINPGGGAAESMIKLLSKKSLMAPLERTKAVWVIERIDDLYRIILYGFTSILPDIGQFLRLSFVQGGIHIPDAYFLMSLCLLIGYVFPFLVAGYYMIGSREVAGAI
jgi:hypothetical protein